MIQRKTWAFVLLAVAISLPQVVHAEVADKLPTRLELGVLFLLEIAGGLGALLLSRYRAWIAIPFLAFGILWASIPWIDVVLPSDITEAIGAELGLTYRLETAIATAPLPALSLLALSLSLRRRKRQADCGRS